jgi:hypothetical protein
MEIESMLYAKVHIGYQSNLQFYYYIEYDASLQRNPRYCSSTNVSDGQDDIDG